MRPLKCFRYYSKFKYFYSNILILFLCCITVVFSSDVQGDRKLTQLKVMTVTWTTFLIQIASFQFLWAQLKLNNQRKLYHTEQPPPLHQANEKKPITVTISRNTNIILPLLVHHCNIHINASTNHTNKETHTNGFQLCVDPLQWRTPPETT